MASVEQIGKKLSKILSENAKSKKGCAIAITGEWGIGKTHFWNLFKKKYFKDETRKIAYVSLFGIESLDTLKYEIGIQSHSSNDTEREQESNSKFKNFFTSALNHIKIPELESGGFALSIGRELITGVIGSMVKDTIICIDDLERKSDKLNLKDVMGLINQLKLEKNCQLIVILHQDKADDEFQEYKEKVFDDIFYLTENFDIIKEIINDDEVINIYQEFYDKLGVKNLRFYERVHKDYQEIISQANDLTITSKDNILRNLLVVRYADFYPKELKFENQEQNFIFDLNFILNSNFENFSDVDFIGKIDKLDELFNGFVSFYGMDNWAKLIAENIIYHNINDNLLCDLVSQDRISDEKIRAKIIYDELVSELHSFNVKPDFFNRFYKMSLDIIGNENFNNLSFCYNVIASNNQKLANDFKEKVEIYIKEFIKNRQRKPDFDDFYPFGVPDYDIFSNFIVNEIDGYQPKFDFCEFFLNYDRHTDYNVYVQNKVKNITRDELKYVLWLENDKITSRRNFIKLILSNKYFSNDKKEQVRQWIVELLQEKIQENPDSKVVIEFWLRDTNNLRK